eukprot:527052-Amphidinium_carterae.1
MRPSPKLGPRCSRRIMGSETSPQHGMSPHDSACTACTPNSGEGAAPLHSTEGHSADERRGSASPQ